MSKLTVVLENGSVIHIDDPVNAPLRSGIRDLEQQGTKEIVFNSARTYVKTTGRTSARVSKITGAKENESKVRSEPHKEMWNEVAKVWTNELNTQLSSVLFTPLGFESKLTNTTPSISIESSHNAFCTDLFEDSHSLVFPDKTDLDPFTNTLVDPGLAEYFDPSNIILNVFIIIFSNFNSYI